MPTATGKPKVGERVRLYDWKDRTRFVEGKVTHRVDGELWTVEVLLDGERRPRFVEAYYLASQGLMKVVSS